MNNNVGRPQFNLIPNGLTCHGLCHLYTPTFETAVSTAVSHVHPKAPIKIINYSCAVSMPEVVEVVYSPGINLMYKFMAINVYIFQRLKHFCKNGFWQPTLKNVQLYS